MHIRAVHAETKGVFSRQVVGWSMKPHMRSELLTDALRMEKLSDLARGG